MQIQLNTRGLKGLKDELWPHPLIYRDFFFFFLIWNCEFGTAIFEINRKIVKSLESENE